MTGQPTAPAEILLERVQDAYGEISVTELGHYRFLHFDDDCEQSCLYRPEPGWLEYDYNRVMLLAGLLHPAPKRALLLGLGAGSLVHAALEYLPLRQLDSIELRAEVVRLAQDWFDLPSDPRFGIQLGDARLLIPHQPQVDLLWLDLYIDDGPNALQSQPEFLRTCLDRLTDNGWLILNQWSDPDGRPQQEAQLQQAFGQHYWRCPVEDGNQLLMVPKTASQWPDFEQVAERAARLTAKLGYDLAAYLASWQYEGSLDRLQTTLDSGSLSLTRTEHIMTTQVTLGGNPIQIDGQFLQPGATAPDFCLVGKDLGDISLHSFDGQRKILNIFPSIDTGVCAASVRRFNQQASELDNTVVLCISADLPFAHGRFCAAEGLDKVVTLSTLRQPEFLKAYGVAISSGPLAGLAARSVVVLDEQNRVLYSQLVPEIKDEPDYQAAIASLG